MPGAPGITDDTVASFVKDTPGIAASDPRRGRTGNRLDWILAWPGNRFSPTYASMEVLMWQYGKGNDVSDHYGLKVAQNNLRELSVIQRVPVSPR